MAKYRSQAEEKSPQPLPFGYSFLPPMDTPYDPAPTPPPGPALLDDDESSMLDNFFTTMDSNGFTPDFGQLGQQYKPFDSINFDWSSDLPATFEGSTALLPQPIYPYKPPEKFDEVNRNTSNASSDILVAASMLLQNGASGIHSRQVLDERFLNPCSFATQNNHAFAASSRGKGLRQNNRVAGKDPEISVSCSQIPVGIHTSEMLFDIREPVSADQRPPKARTLQWGSDVSFMDQGYIAPPGQPNEEQQTKKLLTNLECLQRQISAGNTRAPSPERITSNTYLLESSTNGQQTVYTNGPDDSVQFKKRQRSLIKEEDGDETSDADRLRSRTRRPKSAALNKDRRSSSDFLVRRPKLQPSTKSAREGLTEEQKRTNHILSEQKRRNLIRQGFDELCSLVPSLRGGGFSKSAMLTQAADWLEDVLRENEILTARLSDLKAVNSPAIPR